MTKKKSETDKIRTTIQKYINKWISEEWFAGRVYELIGKTCYENQEHNDVYIDVSVDEINDHLQNLVDFARQYGFTYPMSYKEFLRYAGDDDINFFEKFRGMTDMDTDKKYQALLNKSIESEKRAIASYSEGLQALNNYDGMEAFELRQVAVNNLADEYDHLDKFNFLQTEHMTAEQYPMVFGLTQ